ncbi:hypothetical protein HW555_010437 [Spodoptera exigua]|uniref:Uncharacterized protein n=1 Tax=Spodoptera exigua TaxID=7107 RepID=A0A835GB81_SPOEX|nr:hypothetical protein HW555_010437 [Spodoptera exigua]
MEKQAVDTIKESLETPRGTQPAGAEESSAVKDSSSTGARLLTTDRKLPLVQHTFDAKAARLNLKKRLDRNTWREELARRDDDHIVNLQPNARANIATTRTVRVTPIVTKKKIKSNFCWPRYIRNLDGTKTFEETVRPKLVATATREERGRIEQPPHELFDLKN